MVRPMLAAATFSAVAALSFQASAQTRQQIDWCGVQSEDGLERILRAVAVDIAWPVSAGDEAFTLVVRTTGVLP